MSRREALGGCAIATGGVAVLTDWRGFGTRQVPRRGRRILGVGGDVADPTDPWAIRMRIFSATVYFAIAPGRIIASVMRLAAQCRLNSRFFGAMLQPECLPNSTSARRLVASRSSSRPTMRFLRTADALRSEAGRGMPAVDGATRLPAETKSLQTRL